MGYIDQFVASVSFDVKKVINWRDQTVWKSVLYVLVFLIVVGAITAFLRWDITLEELREAAELGEVSLYGADAEEALRFAHIVTQYVYVFIDVLAHFLMISLIAFVGARGYKSIRKVTYKEVWNVTAYGITLPVLIRLVAHGLNFNFGGITFLYWGSMMLFSLLGLREIVNLPVADDLEKRL